VTPGIKRQGNLQLFYLLSTKIPDHELSGQYFYIVITPRETGSGGIVGVISMKWTALLLDVNQNYRAYTGYTSLL
jgi:hypothetical protein